MQIFVFKSVKNLCFVNRCRSKGKGRKRYVSQHVCKDELAKIILCARMCIKRRGKFASLENFSYLCLLFSRELHESAQT